MMAIMNTTMQSTPQLAQTISHKVQTLIGTQRSMSQRELAEQIGIPTMVLNRTINGAATPTADAIVKMAAHFGVSTDELLGVPTPKRKKRR